jgi:tetratricopeptide (TPR) repeat protein
VKEAKQKRSVPNDENKMTRWSAIASKGAIMIAPVAFLLACSAGDGGVTPTVLSPEADAEYKQQVELARQMLDKGQTQESLAPLERSRELNPDAFAVQNNYCVAYGNLGLRDQAISACERALEIEPDSQLAKNNLKWVSGIKPAIAPPQQ